ncbi:MAG: peptide deformylase [Candidatus Brocadia sp.]|jgi:peptide deformylase|uniref:Peptide deformylase n=1 Tax=Candidatus Brocadia fulgida TaxID=380242 RepID=A0A0M2UYX2_9BACT|nr:MAG: peptide deformylase [Candidatus Brocadia fulgida]MCE7911485.1 peptide deformylase [Candidatus Brocadia sp. AMX3]MDG5996445.1 peptide deformylase [Candidatus Brocadia sp.]OQY98372.1 MAG: peptide deformylase [Candidatus Brocadia sp. UTAMX2]RIK01398.1 MAG: peptide deformylase [Candidatus Brocadia sp.]
MNIVFYPDPVLRSKAKPLTEINREVCRKAEEMMELMHQAQGVGLAAPQVGWSVRLFIIDVEGTRCDEKVFINPVIIEDDGELNKEEGCLSFPGITSRIIRAQRIRAEAYTLKGQKVEIEAEGLAARAWQHELDHLNGDLFIDKMSPSNRLAISHQLKEFERLYKGARVSV